LVSLYSRGEVCTMAPLHMHDGMKEHPLYEQSLLALATLTKVKALSVVIHILEHQLVLVESLTAALVCYSQLPTAVQCTSPSRSHKLETID